MEPKFKKHDKVIIGECTSCVYTVIENRPSDIVKVGDDFEGVLYIPLGYLSHAPKTETKES